MDPRTSFIIATAFALLNGGILGLMHRGLSRQIRPSAADWRIGTLLAAGGVLLLAAQSPGSEWLLLPLGNTSIFLGFSLYWRSIRRFDHLPDTKWVYLPSAIGAVALTWFTVVTPLLWVRVCITSIVWNTAMLISSYSLLRHRQSKHEIGRICLAGIFISLIGFMSFRAMYFAIYLRNSETILATDHFINIITPLVTAILPVIGTTAFLMMCSERLRSELASRAIELDQKNADLKQAILAREDAERIARHDLKTPLASIAAAPALLRENSESREELLQMIEGAARRALNMVNLSLDLYHMEKGRYQLQAKAFDMKAVVETVLEDLREHAAAKYLKLKFNHPPHTMAWGDAALSYSCIANLVKNAIEAASEQSAVELDIESGELLTLHIHNNTAVPPSLRANFFDKYATLGKEGGTGLGTYSSRLLAKVQNGDLTMLTSDANGTTLSLSLPTYQREQIAEVNSDHIEHTPYRRLRLDPQRRIRVLMVDDDHYNSRVISHQLNHTGIEISTALNGKFAWYACLKERPDLILMDIEMPVMNGIEALLAIRELQAIRQQTPSVIVAFSSDDNLDSHQRFFDLGFNDCLSKPASTEALFKLIASLPDIAPHTAAWEPVKIHPNLLFDIDQYLRSRFALIDDMNKKIAQQDTEGTRKIAHKLSGSFSLYGFEWAAQQCKLLETGAQSSEQKELLVQELRQHLSEVAIMETQIHEHS